MLHSTSKAFDNWCALWHYLALSLCILSRWGMHNERLANITNSQSHVLILGHKHAQHVSHPTWWPVTTPIVNMDMNSWWPQNNFILNMSSQTSLGAKYIKYPNQCALLFGVTWCNNVLPRSSISIDESSIGC